MSSIEGNTSKKAKMEQASLPVIRYGTILARSILTTKYTLHEKDFFNAFGDDRLCNLGKCTSSNQGQGRASTQASATSARLCIPAPARFSRSAPTPAHLYSQASSQVSSSEGCDPRSYKWDNSNLSAKISGGIVHYQPNACSIMLSCFDDSQAQNLYPFCSSNKMRSSEWSAFFCHPLNFTNFFRSLLN